MAESELQLARVRLNQSLHGLMQPLLVGNIGATYARLDEGLGGDPELWLQARQLSEGLRELTERWLNFPDFQPEDRDTLQSLQILRTKRFAEQHLSGNLALAVDAVLFENFAAEVATFGDLHLCSRFRRLTMEEQHSMLQAKTSLLANIPLIANADGESSIGPQQAMGLLNQFAANIDQQLLPKRGRSAAH